MTAWVKAYVGLGSNLDDPEAQIRRGYAALARLRECRDPHASGLYLSRPFGGVEQPDYINAVASIETGLSPEVLLAALQDIERRQHRTREVHWGPRTLDLDILLYGDKIVNRPDLVIPHPGLAQRDFVLYPLCEIAPEIVIPGLGPVGDCLKSCANRGLERLDREPLSAARDDEGAVSGET
ncbi:MAG: 2-amino-4-hydroxy-6-hydroxymethyldihydropteridine diphosphokinase [Gammaproteobacteria bacterium]|nr:2-amino-4-hydroxy-6-hydroxymethyldihydropteridine diphosphokinase [Gammaproteobacteria bacterium]